MPCGWERHGRGATNSPLADWRNPRVQLIVWQIQTHVCGVLGNNPKHVTMPAAGLAISLRVPVSCWPPQRAPRQTPPPF